MVPDIRGSLRSLSEATYRAASLNNKIILPVIIYLVLGFALVFLHFPSDILTVNMRENSLSLISKQTDNKGYVLPVVFHSVLRYACPCHTAHSCVAGQET